MSIKSKYKDTLNALVAMQQSLLYAARSTVLKEAEHIIVELEAKTEPKIEVRLIKYRGKSGGFGKVEDRYKVVLYNVPTGHSRTVDNNSGWGHPYQYALPKAQDWAYLFNVEIKEYEEKDIATPQIVLSELL